MVHDSPKRRQTPKVQSMGRNNRCFADLCVLAKELKTGKENVLRAFLDSGCFKSIILGKFTSPNAQNRLKNEDYSKY